jgi:hypothetical protein
MDESSVRLLKFLTGTENAGMMGAGARRVSERFAFTDRPLPFLEIGSLVFERINHIAMCSLESLGYRQSLELYDQPVGASLIVWEGNTSLPIRLKPRLGLYAFNNRQIH